MFEALSQTSDPTDQPVLRNIRYGFGDFVLDLAQMLLLESDQPIRLGSSAMLLLIALIERAGEVVSRQALEARAWPDTLREQTNLRVHIGALRRALRDGIGGARYITNVPGRGYCFVAPVQVLPAGAAPGSAVPRPSPAALQTVHLGNLPLRLSPVVGRAEVTTALAAQLVRRRLVSIVGPGGIGKTTVALAVAQASIDNYKDGVWFVDLAPLRDPSLMPASLGCTFGLTMGMDATPETCMKALCAFLRSRQLLIVLDNCEHVIASAAFTAESLMQTAPGVHILATTREPLDAEGEWVHRLAALHTPGVAECLSIQQAMGFSAIQLFVERASASANRFALTDASLVAVRQICHQLDGVPLALELAAARVDTLGIHGLALHLHGLFQLLTRGRRTALPRHQTLEALIAWSYNLLGYSEQVVLRRLSVFRSSFTLDSAARVVADGAPGAHITVAEAVESVLGLLSKSLVHLEACTEPSNFCDRSQGRRYRMLYMTRVYAAQRLEESGESVSVSRRHADHVCALANGMTVRWGDMSTGENVSVHDSMIDDMCAALDWALSPQGDYGIGIALVIATGHPVFSMNMNARYRISLDVTLDRVAQLSPPQPRLELQLSATWFFLSAQSLSVRRSQSEVYLRAIALIDAVGLEDLSFDVLYGLCVGSFGLGYYPALSGFATRLRALAEDDDEPLSVLVAERMLVLGHHYLGQHDEARALATRVMGYDVTGRYHWFVGPVPRGVSMRIVNARILWLQGQVDQAVDIANEAAQHAHGEHPFAICQALALAVIPIALWRGEWQRAEQWIAQLVSHASRPALAYWLSWANSYRQVLRLQQNSSTGCTPQARSAEAWVMPSTPMELDMLGTHSVELLSPQAVDRVNQALVGWCAPEILRASAEKMMLDHAPIGTAPDDVLTAAEELLMRALQIAKTHKTISWELRAASSLARLYLRQGNQGKIREAGERLGTLSSRFSEGLETMDLREAERLLGECSTAEINSTANQKTKTKAKAAPRSNLQWTEGLRQPLPPGNRRRA